MTAHTTTLLVVLSLALVACDGLQTADQQMDAKRPAADNGEQLEADIMAGRVEVMLQQAHAGLEVIGLKPPPNVELPTDRETLRRLGDSVARYNDLNRAACANGLAQGAACAPYNPAWLANRPSSPAALKAAAEDLQDTTTELWDAVCVKAKAKSGDEHFCAIE